MTPHLRAAWLAGGARSARAAWLHRLSRRALRLLGARIVVHGEMPRAGLVVANHLGYLDVLVLAAVSPAVFVAKSEVRGWPVVGWLCRRAGTIFVERGRRVPVRGCLERVLAALRAGNAVVLFPEGTSSGGAGVLPFKTSLLAAARVCPVTPAAIAYRMPPGHDPAEEICYWRDMTFGPHLWNVLGGPGFVAVLRFGAPHAPGLHRKRLAAALHAEVVGLRPTASGQAAGQAAPAAGRFSMVGVALRAIPIVSGKTHRASDDPPSHIWDGSESHPYHSPERPAA